MRQTNISNLTHPTQTEQAKTPTHPYSGFCASSYPSIQTTKATNLLQSKACIRLYSLYSAPDKSVVLFILKVDNIYLFSI